MAGDSRAPAAHLERYIDAGYPAHAGMSEGAFRSWLAPLVSDAVEAVCDPTTGAIPALLVVRQRVVGADAAMAAVEVRGKSGYVDMDPREPAVFDEVDSITTPDADAYVLLGFDPGDALRNAPPSAALPQIVTAGRSPLTIDEALSAVALHPELVARKHAFSMLASRSHVAPMRQCVPALWISRGAPRLGWCWDNNPHTWLGSASCAARSSADTPRTSHGERPGRRPYLQ